MITRNDILQDFAEFSWSFGTIFFVETYNHGNFVWSDPDYQGDNTFRQVNQSFEEYSGDQVFRDKGTRSVSGYCGDEIKIFLLNGTQL